MAPKLVGSSCSSDKVKVETMARIKSIPSGSTRDDFAVMVRVTAPPPGESSRGAPVDLVAVLDISSSMRGRRLESMKEAMRFVIDNLGPKDRLSIVPFAGSVSEDDVMGLSSMSDKNRRQEARMKVNGLQAQRGTDMAKGLEMAVSILQKRRPEDQGARAGRIIFLSDGNDRRIKKKKISSDFPADTFGLDAEHNPELLRYIADQTLGTYSYVNEDVTKIKSAFAQSIGGLTSIAAMDIEIRLRTTGEGVTISSIQSGAYENIIADGKRSGTIRVPDMYAGEQKNFIVFLSVPKQTRSLMTVAGCYKTFRNDRVVSMHLDCSEVAVERPSSSDSDTPRADESVADVEPEVAAELARRELVKGVKELADEGKGEELPLADRLQALKERIQGSVDGRRAPQILESLGKEVDRMKSDKPFMLSWLTSHLWQRATTKDSPSDSQAFQTLAMKELVHQADQPERRPESFSQPRQDSPQTPTVNNVSPAQAEPEPIKLIPAAAADDNDNFKIMCDTAITCAAEHPYYSCALALFLLAGALLTLQLHEHATTPPIPPPVVTIWNVTQHPGWLGLEKSLQEITLKKMDNSGIASLLHDATAEDMSYATTRYLLLALVHASTLRSRCASASTTVALLEEKAQTLEAEKTELSGKLDEALVRNEEEKGMEEELNRADSRTAALTAKLDDLLLKEKEKETRWTEPTRGSPSSSGSCRTRRPSRTACCRRSPLANAEKHLKTCNQRVGMLEAKLRDMEAAVAAQ